MSQIRTVTMPKWGMEMTEGLIGDWHVAVGAEVSEGDDLVDVETSKIVNTVTAPSSGVLHRILANTGDELPVGAILGVMAPADTGEQAIEEFVHSLVDNAPAPAAPSPAAETAPPRQAGAVASTETAPATPATEQDAGAAGLAALAEGPDDSAVAASPVARRLAAHYGVNLRNVPATGRHGRVSKRDLESAVTTAGGKPLSPAPPRSDSGRTAGDDSGVHATPVARRLAAELGISLLDCRVSGSRGRVCKADVEARAALEGRASAAGVPVAEAAASPGFEERPLTGMRKTIAARLQQSKQTAPHFRVHVDATIDGLLALRRTLNDSTPEAKLSVNDFIVKACACALVRVPEVNIQFDGETVRYFEDADIAVAVALEDGLITPIVKGANRKGLIAISNEVRDLATRARVGRLQPEEFQGGTFSVSNLGMFGVRQFDAIINPPHGAILAIGSAETRPVWRDGAWQPATVLSLSLSSDHRIIDGAVAARFMSALKGFLEQPGTMLG